MGINPLAELKRRLEDSSTPLPKRLCLAKNVTITQYLPATAKERTLIDWLNCTEICKDIVDNILTWQLDEAGNELLGKLVEVIAIYLKKCPEENDFIEKIVSFLGNDKIHSQLTFQADNYFIIITALLTSLKHSDSTDRINLCCSIFDNVKKTYKNSTKKLDFIVKFITGQNLEVFFDYLSDNKLREQSLNVCETILFPQAKKGNYSLFLQTIFRQENIDQLLEEKGDNVKAVVKIMSVFFTFPKDRTEKDPKFLINFIDAFVNAFKNDSNLVFMFFIMAANSLKIRQTYLSPAMTMPFIIFEGNDDKIKRNIILKCLEILKANEIDLNVKLTEILGEKVTRVEIKKNFSSFLQAVIMGAVKLEGKPDKSTIKIITASLTLDPNLIEPKLDMILPNIMACKKQNIKDVYVEMLNCLLETLFKLSRGTEFISKVLPSIKTQLEAVNTDQFELRQKSLDENADVEKFHSKIIMGDDIFPNKCVEKFGKLSSDLMLKQNGELFVTLQKEFETHCLIMLEDGYVSPSLIILSEVLSSILSSFMMYTKMADHTVPNNIAKEFWSSFTSFRDELLSKYGRCALNLSYNRQLTLAYLDLCRNYVNLKLMHLRYGNTQFESESKSCDKNTEVLDFGAVLPCLDENEWIELSKRILDEKDMACIEHLNSLIFQKIIACDLCNDKELNSKTQEHKSKLKSYLIADIDNLWPLFEKYPYYANILFEDLDQTMETNVAKAINRKLNTDLDVDVIKNTGIANNKSLLTCITMEALQTALKLIEDDEFLKTNKSIRKALKAGFEFEEVVKGSDFKTAFENLSKSKSLDAEESHDNVNNFLEIVKSLKVSILDENTQLLTLFVLLSIKNILSEKKCKKLKKNLDDTLLQLYEMFQKNPNIFKLFPIEYIFSFDNQFLELLMLSKSKANNRSIIIKATLETAVKKIKSDSDIIKNVVAILLANKNKTKNINFFGNKSNHIVCMILPIIAKEKKNITTSQYRSVLADLQEKLHKFLLKSFKNINFTGDTDLTDEDSEMATLNALESYSLTLSKYCESNEENEYLKDLSSSLGFFVKNAISAIENKDTKAHHIDASFQLLNVVFRNVRKLSTHEIFKEKDQIFAETWRAVKERLNIIFHEGAKGDLDEIAVVIKFISELGSIELFTTKICADLSNYVTLKTPKEMTEDTKMPIAHKISGFITSSILKSNIVGPKSAVIAKITLNNLKNVCDWLRNNFEASESAEDEEDASEDVQRIVVDDKLIDIITCSVNSLNDVIVNAKKILLSWRLLDAIFVLNQSLCRLLRHRLTDESFFATANAVVACLNALLLHRQELLEDRWPCFLQCYRSLINGLSHRPSADPARNKATEEKLAEIAHSIEKLTQALCKQKSQISRLSAYLVADLCSHLERTAPSLQTRQHYENCVVLLIQSSESAYASAFLRRALAGNPGHMTLINLYTVYKRYHKYVGTS